MGLRNLQDCTGELAIAEDEQVGVRPSSAAAASTFPTASDAAQALYGSANAAAEDGRTPAAASRCARDTPGMVVLLQVGWNQDHTALSSAVASLKEGAAQLAAAGPASEQ